MVWPCSTNAPVRKSELVQAEGTQKGRRRSKITSVEVGFLKTLIRFGLGLLRLLLLSPTK